ncbi:REC [Musa troglodytarum]|uniref:REC n=1 Tax=Musa troglodytarum TaxID=320322 RepID=A0A9E7G794_9LILI|nr:REC [Musa troglodytarum]
MTCQSEIDTRANRSGCCMGQDRYDDSTLPRHSHPSSPLENRQSHRTPSLSLSLSLGHLVGVQRRAVEEMEEVKEEGEEMDVNDCGGGGLEVVRVLVVDDSPVDRKIVEMLLKRSEGIFDVVSVDSGKKAMEVLGLNEIEAKPPNHDDQKIDIVLTDYCMPEMTGLDLLKAVKANSSSRSIPVVMMSSENDSERISRFAASVFTVNFFNCRAIGAEDFILKPLRVKDVQRLRTYTVPIGPMSKRGSKRKLPIALIAESNGAEARPLLAKVAAFGSAVFLTLNFWRSSVMSSSCN